ncbi:DUF2218 domain-containing protein [Phaeacidiphilus oryzae]|uniref:DUF2218 domain-containing protein n=1 Tax=Phaeacidiphilus oryzae TaxID=348818 RepID=UPI0005623810|nr:DUF2218 domain-containing protein [Phaeacidiphilus oryzae]
MPSAQARVATTRADRYLRQLCEHAGRMGHPSGHLGALLGHASGEAHRTPGRLRGAAMPKVLRAESPAAGADDTPEGLIEFDSGRCRLRAEPDLLLLTVDAGDASQLARITDALAARLERIGRRAGLAVTWRSVPSSPTSA